MTPLADLEPDICNLDDMAGLSVHYIEQVITSLRTDKDRCKLKVGLLDDEADRIMFCVYHLRAMTMKLREDFYAKLG